MRRGTAGGPPATRRGRWRRRTRAALDIAGSRELLALPAVSMPADVEARRPTGSTIESPAPESDPDTVTDPVADSDPVPDPVSEPRDRVWHVRRFQRLSLLRIQRDPERRHRVIEVQKLR